MLKKLTELPISAENPFAHDALERKDSIERLTNLVESTQQPFVLSVEAPWGWGKTTFIRMWKAHLESKKHVCLHFNAWESDFVEDPLVGFLGEMTKLVEKETKELNKDEPLKKHWNDVKRIGAGVLRKALPLAVQIGTQGLLRADAVKEIAGSVTESADKVAELASDIAKKRLEKYHAEKHGIIGFRSSLAEFAKAIVTEEGRMSPLVFFIDELDRCRPDFAVTLLERIKHLFNVERVVFVLAVDRNQLNQSVKSLYGLEMEPDGYLRRFIDLAYILPQPTTEQFAASLFNRFGLRECLMDGRYSEILKTGFSIYARLFGLSLRTQEQCFTEMNIVLRIDPTVRGFPATLCFLVVLRAYNPRIFRQLREGSAKLETILASVNAVDDLWYRQWAEATLLAALCDETVVKGHVQALKKQAESGDGPKKQNAEKILQCIGALYQMRMLSNAAESILRHLDMTTQFR